MTNFRSATILANLLAATIISYFVMRGLSKPLPDINLGAKTPASTQEQLIPPVQEKTMTEEERAAKNVRVDYSLLSRRSLFKDTRTEDTDDPNAEGNSVSKADEEEVNRTFELIGIARIGKPDEAEPVAIIEDVSKLNPRGPSRPMRPGMPPMPNNMRGPQPAQTTATTEKASRKIYKVGDTVGTSNYKVKEIIVEEDKVILTRGGKEVAMKIDIANTKNSIRRERVKKEEIDKQAQQQAIAQRQAQQAQQRAQQQQQQQAQQQRLPSSVPQPPPPPPSLPQQNNQPPQRPTNTISSERRQQMEQQRQQILERIRQRQAEQQQRR